MNVWGVFLTCNMWCDQAKWVGTRWNWFWDNILSNKGVQFPLYFIILSITKIAIFLEPYAQFSWGFQCGIEKIQWKWKLRFYFYDLVAHSGGAKMYVFTLLFWPTPPHHRWNTTAELGLKDSENTLILSNSTLLHSLPLVLKSCSSRSRQTHFCWAGGAWPNAACSTAQRRPFPEGIGTTPCSCRGWPPPPVLLTETRKKEKYYC